MSFLNHLRILAKYNRRANKRVYSACEQLSDDERKQDRSGFFNSIHGTLNHIMVGDQIWMARFRGETVPSSGLADILYEDFDHLREERTRFDQEILEFIDAIEPTFLEETISYENSDGYQFDDPVRLLLPHMFNHQTHHRGQVHDMICQTSVKSPVLDMHRVIKPTPGMSILAGGS